MRQRERPRWWKRLPWLFGGLLLGWVAVGGCGNLMNDCQNDTDCPVGQHCASGACQLRQGYLCLAGGACRPVGGRELRCVEEEQHRVCRFPCKKEEDCPPHQECQEQICVPSGHCASPSDCPFGQTCLEQRCTITDQPYPRRVDILFVVDNSDSMKEEQEKLARNFKEFITQLTEQERQTNDFQIGVITTDMDNCKRDCGRLRGAPKILHSQMSAQAMIAAFSQTIRVGTGGAAFEKGLAAARAALSRPLLDDPSANKGFLRPGALLAVIFVTDEDDCSHKGAILEHSYSEVCYFPHDQVVRNEKGEPIIDKKTQKPLYGMMEKRTPVAEYARFFQSLGREVLLAGLLGDPVVSKQDPSHPNRLIPIDPPNGCQQDQHCHIGLERHQCSYIASGKRRCGGCRSEPANAHPGFRYHELFRALGSEHNWFPICGDDQKFVEALLRFASVINANLEFVDLSKTPYDPNTLQVLLISPQGESQTVPRASAQSNSFCTGDYHCPAYSTCGHTGQCFGDGWVYFPPATSQRQKARIKLSGRFKKLAYQGHTATVSYTIFP